ncbi:MAG: HD domain-containing protein [Bacteroidia bacterium]
MQFTKAEEFIREFLQTKLSPLLFYHDYFHTMEVVKATVEIAKDENITDEEDLTILKTAALFHDCGFVNVYHNHEEEGCRIAREKLSLFEYTDDQIEKICDLIMATKTPQAPKTHLQKIICDADLYYLGTDAFEEHGNKLFKEWKAKGKVHSEKDWDELQINFLDSHRYWTDSAIAKREKKKEENLRKLKIATDSQISPT